jgi:hypothetical protein
MTDVTVHAPPMVKRDLAKLKVADPAAYTQELELELRLADMEHQRLRLAMDTFTNIIASFVKIATDQMGGKCDEVMLPRSVIDRMDGSKVTVSEAPGTRDVIVRIREGAPHPLWEGRHG